MGELNYGHRRIPEKKESRRDLLKDGAKLTGLAITGLTAFEVFKRLANGKKVNADPVITTDNNAVDAKILAQADMVVTDEQTLSPTATPVEQKSVVTPTAEKTGIPDYEPADPRISPALKALFPTATKDELIMLTGKVKAQMDVLIQNDVAKYFDPLEKPYKGTNLEQYTIQQAQKVGVDPDNGIADELDESGGKFDAGSQTGALGFNQEEPDSAREKGLFVPDSADDPDYTKHPDLRDERLDPLKSIPVGMDILHDYEVLGDPYIAIDAYNAGIGNVYKMISVESGGKVPMVKDITAANLKQAQAYVQQNNLQFFELIEDPKVQAYMDTLGLYEEAHFYVYQVLGVRLFLQALRAYRAQGKTDAAFIQDLEDAYHKHPDAYRRVFDAAQMPHS